MLTNGTCSIMLLFAVGDVRSMLIVALLVQPLRVHCVHVHPHPGSESGVHGVTVVRRIGTPPTTAVELPRKQTTSRRTARPLSFCFCCFFMSVSPRRLDSCSR